MRGGYRRFFTTLVAQSASWCTLAFSIPHQQTKLSSLIGGGLSVTPLSSSAMSLGYEKLCLGGDFAGLVAKFSPSDGSLVPVPVYLIPEELLEWGQEPSALEVLVSEEWNEESPEQFRRQEITVLPAIGCGVDNLETTKSETVFEKEQTAWSQPSDSTLILDTTTSSDETTTLQRLETQVSLSEAHRVRVSFNLKIENNDATSYEIQSPIILQLERQANTTSSHGTRADGGGLDGRTVFRLLGDRLKNSHSFAERKFSPGEWTSATGKQVTPSSLIHLPGNISIASGAAAEDAKGTWLLEISHFSADEEGSTKGSRRIVQRIFDGVKCETTFKEQVGEYRS